MINAGRQAVFYPLALWLAYCPAAGADDLGRLFTTADQRQQLQASRNRPPEAEITIEPMVLPDPTAPPKPMDTVRVGGVVYRSDGKHTAWINDGNTLAGDLELQHVRIKNEDIEPDRVQITLPDKQTRVKIKVGEHYDPQIHNPAIAK